MICKMPISSERSKDLLDFLEVMRLPVESPKNEIIPSQDEEKKEEEKSSSPINSLNDPTIYSPQVPFLIHDENNETIISRTAKRINERKLNPFEVDWAEVTLYETDFVRDLLEGIDSNFIMDVAQAIDDEDKRHVREDGQYTNIASDYYGTGQGNAIFYSYMRDNWQNDSEYVSAGTIAEGILDKRNKAEKYKKKIETPVVSLTAQPLLGSIPTAPVFDPNTEELLGQIDGLKNEVNQLAREKAALEQSNRELQERVNLCKSNIVIADDRKIDVIKVLHAMCKVGLFKTKDGSKFTIKAVMEFFGEILNDNFSEYSSNLSTSKSTAKKETFLEIFDKIREEAKKYLNKS